MFHIRKQLAALAAVQTDPDTRGKVETVRAVLRDHQKVPERLKPAVAGFLDRAVKIMRKALEQ